MNDLVKFYARPKLRAPYLIAAWPGIANVSMVVAMYLGKQMAFKPLGELNAPYFFDPIGVMVRNNVIEAPQFPQSQFFYWKNKKGDNDIILFIGDDQPPKRL